MGFRILLAPLVVSAALLSCRFAQVEPTWMVVPTPTGHVLTTPLAGASPTPPPTATLTPTLPPSATPTLRPTQTLAQARLAPEDLSVGDPYAPGLGNGGYDVQHVTLRLALDPETQQVEGRAVIDANSTVEGLQQISLDFVGFEIGEVTVDQAPAPYKRQEKKLVVDLPEVIPTSGSFTLNITYQGRPEEEPSVFTPFISHLGMQFRSGSLFVVSEPDGARYWFPANDHPRDKASYRFELLVPEGLTAAANGKLVDTQKGVPRAFSNGAAGDLYVWEHPAPLASALVTVGVGEYVRLDSVSPGGVQLRSYVFPDRQADFSTAGETLGEMIDWMSDLFGPYPFEEFGYLTVDGLGGSLETQTLVVWGADRVDEELMAHEMAHMWFGNWVSLDSWGEMWRNEGFATYVGMMWVTRDDPERLDLQLAALEKELPDSEHPLRNPPPEDLFGNDVYLKGALLVHALRQEMGDEAFFSGLRTYIQRYGGSTASDEEFQSTMEEAFGRSLAAFFEGWLQ